jgi:CBS domain containing-hemolysin-like protein
LLVALFSSLTVRSLRQLSMHELRILSEQAGRTDLVGSVIRSHERIELTAEFVHTIALVSAAGLGTWGYLSLTAGPGIRDFASAIGFVFGLLLAAVLLDIWIAVPLAQVMATRFVFRTWNQWYVVHQILRPLTAGSKLVEFMVYRLSDYQPEPPSEETLEDEIRTIVSEGQREGLLEEDAREMIEGVIELGDVNVSEIMTPRPDMLCLNAGTKLDEATRFFVEAGHSRIPIYDRQRDEVVGVLYIKDLLEELLKDEQTRRASVDELARSPVFVPESKPIDDLLQEFQRQRNHIAIVLNEFGGVAGLVTIEDVLEEIVGEIIDEHDVEEGELLRRIDATTCEVAARTRLEELNEELGLQLEVNGVDTIGGLVFSELGHVPKAGEQLITKNVRITVLEVKRRRVERVRLEILQEAPSEQPQ